MSFTFKLIAALFVFALLFMGAAITLDQQLNHSAVFPLQG